MELHDIIVQPWVSEKTHLQTADRKYTFLVRRNVNKIQVQEAVEKLFKVKVVSVNTQNLRGREGTSWTKMRRIHGRGSKYKKAVVTLAEGYNIPELSETS
jgi:large subunit ribosomal protein L23